MSALVQLEAARDAAQAAVDAELARMRAEAAESTGCRVWLGQWVHLRHVADISDGVTMRHSWCTRGTDGMLEWHPTIERPARTRAHMPAGGKTLNDVDIRLDGAVHGFVARGALEWESHKKEALLVLRVPGLSAAAWTLYFQQAGDTRLHLLRATCNVRRNG